MTLGVTATVFVGGDHETCARCGLWFRSWDNAYPYGDATFVCGDCADVVARERDATVERDGLDEVAEYVAVQGAQDAHAATCSGCWECEPEAAEGLL